jgi:hypothetical protein
MAAIAGWLWPREGPFGGRAADIGPLDGVGWALLLALVFLL